MPLGYLYGAIAGVRNTLYKKGVLKSFSLGVPTISIGNITVGGTGKTPLVGYVAEILAENAENVCILTRGYKRKNPGQRVLVSDRETVYADAAVAGDEPFELARKLLGKAVVVADKNRLAAGEWAREKFDITAFVLDDAFQHLRLKRALDIVCIDATNPFGNGKVLPAGILREPLSNLDRADAFVITRANLTDNTKCLKSTISTFNSKSPIFVSRNEILDLIELNEFHSDIKKRTNIDRHLKNDRTLAFCALGNPQNFFAQLNREEFNLGATEVFPDHHFYRQQDVEKLEKTAEKQNIKALLTTAKDGVKLHRLKFSMPCYIVENKLILDKEPAFRQLILDKFER